MSILFLKYLAKLPFTILYLLSDILYVVVYYLVGYRKNVVLNNLKNAFPDRPENEIRKLCKKFYKHFSELSIEIIKMNRMTEADFRDRVSVKNSELLHDYFKAGKSVIVLTMHYNNWEWSSFIPLHLLHKSFAVYKPLHDKKYDVYLNSNRSRLGAEMIPTHQVLKKIMHARRKQELFSLWLAGDQTPPMHHQFWLIFLNQEALFYPGPATISRRFNYPVVFQQIIKTARGKYEIVFEPLVENPSKLSESEIMKIYIRKMEEVIKERPEYYLWSHKRWKHVRPEGVPLQD